MAIKINGNIVISDTQAITSTSTVSASGNVTGGNLISGGTISSNGNITSAGTISAAGNISASNIFGTLQAGAGDVTATNLSATGNISAAQHITGVDVSVYGTTVTGDNALFAGALGSTNLGSQVVLQVTGNVNSYSQVNKQNISSGSEASGDYIVTADNGTDSTNFVDLGIGSSTYAPSGFPVYGHNDAYILNNGGNFLLNTQTPGKVVKIVVGGVANSNIVTTISSTGMSVTGLVSATGNVTGNYLLGNAFYVTGLSPTQIYSGNSNVNIPSSAGNVAVSVGGTPNVAVFATTGEYVTGVVSATGNVTGGNVLTAGLVSSTGTVTGGNLATGGTTSATGNITGGNVLTGGLVSATGNVRGGNVYTAGDVSATGNVLATGSMSSTGNATHGNILTGGLISATGNLTANNVSATLVAGTLTTAAQPNITSVGVLTSLAVAGNISPGGISMGAGNATIGNLYVSGTTTIAGNIQQISGNAGQFFGNSATGYNALYAGLPAGFTLLPQSVVNSITTDNNFSQVNLQNQSGGNKATADYIITGNNGDNGNYYLDLGFAGSGYDGTVAILNDELGNVVTPNDGFLYVHGNTAGNIASDFVLATPDAGSQIRVAVGGSTTANISFKVNAPNTAATSNTTGTLNVLGGIGLSGAVFATGNVTGGNVLTAGLISSTGNITGGNLSVGIANIVTANIGSLTVTGNEVDTGNITGGNLLTGGLISATGNITGGNISATNHTGTTVSVTANVTGGNVLTAGIVSATGNVTGNYLLGNAFYVTGLSPTNIYNGTSNVSVVSAGGNVAVGVGGTSNVVVWATTGAYVSGLMSVTGNVSGGNISATNHTGTTVSVTGTVTGGNLATGGNVTASGLISAGGNVTGANILTGGLISATSTITGGNLATGGTVSATGNIVGGNITTAGVITVNSGAAATAIVNGAANTVGNIGSSTGWFNTLYATSTKALYADLAENYTADAEYAPGTVLVFGGTAEVTVNAVDGDRKVAGVVSTNPSYVMNAGLEGDLVATVALTGRVPCFVVGPVKKGDLMVTAGLGRARAEEDPKVGTVIGKALEDFDGAEGTIEVVVGRF